MKFIYSSVTFLLIVFLLMSCTSESNQNREIIQDGVSWDLAQFRKAVISDVHYKLYFDIPSNREEPISGQSITTFNYKKSDAQRDLLMDFKADSSKIKKVKVNMKEVDFHFKNEHIILPDSVLIEGNNIVEFEFTAGDEALNRRKDYLYTLFVPDRARSAFPNFEQPNLKATFELGLSIPLDWEAIANGKIKNVQEMENKKLISFERSAKLPTYLFSFVAGKFEVATKTWRNQEIKLFYRETDKEKIEASIDPIFDSYINNIEFYENWTGIPFPFEEFGMVAIPDFQFGGMEHPGAILLKESTLFLPDKATQSQLDNREHLIAHEVAHMWFGDLVTMNWFDDVWTKEVFANFMAAKATSDTTAMDNNRLKFILDHVPGAYDVDRTLGANPIHSKLDNLKDANSMYGAIIYLKAPLMMQQLETLMGQENFQKGLQKYLKEFAFDNATWEDLIRILNKETDKDLITWNEVWVNTPGRPVFKDSLIVEEGKIKALFLKQSDLTKQGRVWPQSFDISLVYADTIKTITITIKDTVSDQSVAQVKGWDKPEKIWYNSNGMGYGVMPPIDKDAQELGKLPEAYNRAAQYISIYENMLEERNFTPKTALNVFLAALKQEKEERNIGLLGWYINTIYWVFMDAERRQSIHKTTEDQIWSALESQSNENIKKELFKIYKNIFESKAAEKQLYTIWKEENPPKGVHLKEDDYMELAYALLLRHPYDNILDEQYDRLNNSDKKARFEIIRPALSKEVAVRDEFFNGLSNKSNRADESAVLEALRWLHHPLRQKDSEKYLGEALSWLPKIQYTNSLFFPERWVQANFSQYSSESAYDIVQDFLDENPGFNPKLKEKVLQATDNLRRAQYLKR